METQLSQAPEPKLRVPRVTFRNACPSTGPHWIFSYNLRYFFFLFCIFVFTPNWGYKHKADETNSGGKRSEIFTSFQASHLACRFPRHPRHPALTRTPHCPRCWERLRGRLDFHSQLAEARQHPVSPPAWRQRGPAKTGDWNVIRSLMT